MAHNHKSHFIPSPFPAVTQYENAFIKAWNENTARAVAEVLKYIAKATASAIKDKDVPLDDGIQKAQVNVTFDDLTELSKQISVLEAQEKKIEEEMRESSDDEETEFEHSFVKRLDNVRKRKRALVSKLDNNKTE